MSSGRCGALDTEECFPPTLILHGSLNGAQRGVWTCPLSRLWPSYMVGGGEDGERVDRRREGALTGPTRPNATAS